MARSPELMNAVAESAFSAVCIQADSSVHGQQPASIEDIATVRRGP